MTAEEAERRRKEAETAERRRKQREKIARDYEIKGRVLVKYKGPGGKVVIPRGITKIGDQAFARCRNLTAVDIPNSVNEIGIFAFYGCTGLAGNTYQGTQKEWDAIKKGEGWDINTGEYYLHCCNGAFWFC